MDQADIGWTELSIRRARKRGSAAKGYELKGFAGVWKLDKSRIHLDDRYTAIKAIGPDWVVIRVSKPYYRWLEAAAKAIEEGGRIPRLGFHQSAPTVGSVDTRGHHRLLAPWLKKS